MNKIINKRGYYRFADVGMFFLCFVIIAVGIMIGIYLFYSNTIDVRGQEAKIIYEKLLDALIENNKLNQKVLDSEFNILQEASIDKEIINNGYFYFKIEVFEKDFEKEIVKKIQEGNRDFEVECFLRSKKFPRCYPEKDFKLILDDYEIKILTASNQLGEG